MIFREAKRDDLDNIMKVISSGKKSLKALEIDQWQKGNPNREQILRDIRNHESFLIENQDEIIGTAALVRGIDRVYEEIYEGSWIECNNYCAIHRIAVLDHYKNAGVASKLLENLEKQAGYWKLTDVRIDTHPGNTVMQKWIVKHKFHYCGKVDQADGMRLAYQKLLVNDEE
ncbi:MAG: GNAT family N-acetyltransferase [Fusobacteria bacterium]|nr:GNAT family N-acetyltransferase [Fusobacteriota bacterium]